MYSVVLMAALTTGGTTPDCHFRRVAVATAVATAAAMVAATAAATAAAMAAATVVATAAAMVAATVAATVAGAATAAGAAAAATAACYGWRRWLSRRSTYPGAVMQAGRGHHASRRRAAQTQAEHEGKETMSCCRRRPSWSSNCRPTPSCSSTIMPMKTTSGMRTFSTPRWSRARLTTTSCRVETVRDGKPVSETRRVIVRAGQTARADFKELEADAVQDRSGQVSGLKFSNESVPPLAAIQRVSSCLAEQLNS